MSEPWRAGAEHLAAGRVQAAHEAWEDAWLPLRGTDEGEVLRGLAQLGAACVHQAAGRERGCRSVARAAAARLATLVDRGVERSMGLDVAVLAREIEAFAAAEDVLAARAPRVEAAPERGGDARDRS